MYFSRYRPPMNLPIRPRRNRRTAALRRLVSETALCPSHFILPLFVCKGRGRREASAGTASSPSAITGRLIR